VIKTKDLNLENWAPGFKLPVDPHQKTLLLVWVDVHCLEYLKPRIWIWKIGPQASRRLRIRTRKLCFELFFFCTTTWDYQSNFKIDCTGPLVEKDLDKCVAVYCSVRLSLSLTHKKIERKKSVLRSVCCSVLQCIAKCLAVCAAMCVEVCMLQVHVVMCGAIYVAVYER